MVRLLVGWGVGAWGSYGVEALVSIGSVVFGAEGGSYGVAVGMALLDYAARVVRLQVHLVVEARWGDPVSQQVHVRVLQSLECVLGMVIGAVAF